jgi:hypothetical protein
VGQAAADRAAVAHLRVADRRGRIDQRLVALQAGVAGDLIIGRERADAPAAALGGHAAQLTDIAQVDQQRGRRQAQLHHRQQAMAARQRLGLGVLRQRQQRLVQRRGRGILELCRDHTYSLMLEQRTK